MAQGNYRLWLTDQECATRIELRDLTPEQMNMIAGMRASANVGRRQTVQGKYELEWAFESQQR